MDKVQIREDCKRCEGTGLIQAPEWAEFWALPNAQKMPTDEIWTWFKEKGYIYSSNNSKGLYGESFENFPNKEIPCCDCEGAGYIAKWIPIADFLALCPGAPRVQVAK